jgi:hypothetical protein
MERCPPYLELPFSRIRTGWLNAVVAPEPCAGLLLTISHGCAFGLSSHIGRLAADGASALASFSLFLQVLRVRALPSNAPMLNDFSGKTLEGMGFLQKCHTLHPPMMSVYEHLRITLGA